MRRIRKEKSPTRTHSAGNPELRANQKQEGTMATSKLVSPHGSDKLKVLLLEGKEREVTDKVKMCGHIG